MKEVSVLLLCLSLVGGKAAGLGPPGKPTLINCRSPEKETFTCWWKPGSDGGLPTTYALYYVKDNSDTLYECPDYQTEGENSCFFNKYETSVWVNYNITVVATNEKGRTFSDPVDVDVAYIVQPHTPENVSVTVMEDNGWPFLRVSWESPHKADIRSGWITLIYELRSKMEGEDEWEENYPGQQKTFNIFSVRSGRTYLVEVRCRPDHGLWSDWSPTTTIKVPQYFLGERYLWILIFVFSSLVILILIWIIYMNSQSLKRCILPPIPGPKIKGFDHQHIKNGDYKDCFSTLMIPEFPPTSSLDHDNLLVEIFVRDEQEASTEEEGKDLQENYCKSESSMFDSDSGHGSCDSHILLIDKSKWTDNEEAISNRDVVKPEISQNSRAERPSSYHSSPDACDGRVKTWPSLFSPAPPYTSSAIPQKSSLERMKQHCYSDSLFAPISSDKEKHKKEAKRELQASQSDVFDNVFLTPFSSTQYVEVQKVCSNDTVLLQPVVELNRRHAEAEGCSCVVGQGEDYSKVKGVDGGNMVLLESGGNGAGMEMDCFCDKMEERRSCLANVKTHKNVSMQIAVQQAQGEQRQMVDNCYVDTATMFSVPMC
ncbi:unnamed protein product [Knipowitschia caucasica]|uniref:Prolactin receptor n=1 Tax=Knipowitschia caucasica TaxID=637954 RepID=A0AAV2IU02_KNICA